MWDDGLGMKSTLTGTFNAVTNADCLAVVEIVSVAGSDAVVVVVG